MDINHMLKDFFCSFPDAGQPLVVRGPGRINIIGEHTDYNQGFVLPAAINKAAYITVSLREDNEIHLYAKDIGEKYWIGHSANLKPSGQPDWFNYLTGAAAQFLRRGVSLRGFNMMLTSNIPMGAGLSSSAAITCSAVYALNKLLAADFTRQEMAAMAQVAEHEFSGVKCGIMDQFASMMGMRNHLMKLDCRTLQYEYIPFNIEPFKILLLNTNVQHQLSSSEYNKRREECEVAVAWMQQGGVKVSALRDVTLGMVERHVTPKNEKIGMRSKFVIQEMARVIASCYDMKNNDVNMLGHRMFQAHRGLSKMYEVSCKELDWLVASVVGNPAVAGARMMGGGFGGCTINLIKEAAIDPLLAFLKPAYEKYTGLQLSHHVVSAENGTEVIYRPDAYAHLDS